VNIDISSLFGPVGKKFMKASLKLRISNEIPNLAFIRHIINYYSFYCTAGEYTSEATDNLLALRDQLPKLKEMTKYLKEHDISSLNKFVRFSVLSRSHSNCLGTAKYQGCAGHPLLHGQNV
jgi:hypothetical protein